MSQDLRQKHLFDFCSNLTPEDREDLGRLAIKINTLRRVEDAIEKGHVQTPTFIPGWFDDKSYIAALQWLSFFAIRGYFSENHKSAELHDIYNRVLEKIRGANRDGTWPKEWKFPSKRSIDRRVNEIASNKVLENHIMRDGKPRVIATSAGYYIPSPLLYPDVADILEGRRK
jgi:hypothetical protein